ncbi:MAG: UDP-N-acetylmuramoyl-tripeptide--D-alanyl-D-alanine ligase [Kiritimatiellia bacterium]
MQKDTDKKPVAFDSADFSGWIDGVMRNMPGTFRGVTQDTRKLKPGMLYVALRGENFDGHDFVPDALAAGASGALVNDSWHIPDQLNASPLIQVKNTRSALLEAARAWRKLNSAKIIGVTGSSGKTTTKEITAALLASRGRKVCRTEGNMNNDVGLPLSLLSMPRDCDFGVFELGTNHPGEISVLADVLQPDFGIITSVGSAHIENFGSRDAIVREKGAMLASIPPEGCAFISMETNGFSTLKQMSSVPVFTVSTRNKDADFYGFVLNEMNGHIRVTRLCTRECTELRSGLPGIYNADNLLLAFALAGIAGVSCLDAASALEKVTLPAMRWQRIECEKGVELINDAYNANPESVDAVLKLFMNMTTEGRKIVVLGDMLELGDSAPELHRNVGAVVAASAPHLLCAVGPLSSEYISDGAVAKGFPQDRIMHFKDASAAGKALKKSVLPNDTLLLKASRGMKLEKIIEELKGEL